MSRPFSEHCAKLGIPLDKSNSLYAINPSEGTAIFCLWLDKIYDGKYVLWHDDGVRYEPARNQLLDALHIMGGTYTVYGVLCEPQTQSASNNLIANYRDDVLLRLHVQQESIGFVAYIEGKLSICPETYKLKPWRSAVEDSNAPPPGLLIGKCDLDSPTTYAIDNCVRQFVLGRANGRCEHCGRFGFELDGDRFYLETHRLISSTSEGTDTVTNVIALCAEHHREAHYGLRAQELEMSFQQKLLEVGNQSAKN